MAEVKDILQEYVATANNPQYKSDWNIINSKFPELKGYDAKLLQEYVATANNPQYKSNFQTINSKFPELFSQQQQAIQPKQTTTNGIGVLKSTAQDLGFNSSMFKIPTFNNNQQPIPIAEKKVIGTPTKEQLLTGDYLIDNGQKGFVDKSVLGTGTQVVQPETVTEEVNPYLVDVTDKSSDNTHVNEKGITPVSKLSAVNTLSTEELLNTDKEQVRQFLNKYKSQDQLDFENESNSNNNIQKFNGEMSIYDAHIKALNDRSKYYESSLKAKYGEDFFSGISKQNTEIQNEAQQFGLYSTKRKKEYDRLVLELKDIEKQITENQLPREQAEPMYNAKLAQIKAIESDINGKRNDIIKKQDEVNSKIQDADFTTYIDINDKINQLTNEANSTISKPEFAEYRKLLDEGDKAQAKKDAMKKAYQSKGILGKAVDIYAGIGMATNPAAYFLDDGEQVDKTFTGAKIADEGDKLLGRTLKALASVPKMLDISNPIGDENKYDVFDKMFDQAIYASKKRDILNPTATDVQRDIIQKYADVGGYRVMLDENGKPTNDVRDASFYKVNDKTQKEITDKYNENPKAYKTESDFSFSTLTTKATPTILDMGTMMATAMLTGGTTGLVAGAGTAGTVSTATTVGVSAAQMYGDVYESGLNAGLTPQEANDFATLTSIMTGMVSLVNPMEANIVKGTASKSIGKFISNSISKADVQLIRSGEMSIGQYAKRMAKEGVKNTFGENLEELVLEPAVQRATETYYNTKAQKNGQQGFEDLNKPFFDTKQTIETAMITTMASLLMTPIEVANSVPEQRKIALQNALDNPQQFLDIRQKMLEDGDIEKGKFDYEVKAFEEISKQYNTVKPNIKEDLHDDLAELLLKKYTLKNTMSQVNDEVLNKKNQLLLDDINKRLEEVADGTYNKGKEKALSNIANPNTLIEEDKIATYNGAEVTILDDLADGEVVINTNNPEIGEDGIITVEKSSLTDVRNKPKDIEQLQITNAVININGKEYEGKNHAEAILKAQADGQDISQVDRQAEGLFKLSDGTIINREQAKEQFGQDRSELIIPQDEASNQANVEYKRIQDEQENPITPVEPINAGQELNNGTGIQQVDGNGGEIQQGDGIGQVSGQEVPTEKVEEGVTPGLKDVEATAKALEGVDLTTKIPIQQINELNKQLYNNLFDKHKELLAKGERDFDNNEEIKSIKEQIAFSEALIKNDTKAISEAYHKAKADGSNPELVKAVEEALTPTPEVSKPVSEIAKTPISKTETTERKLKNDKHDRMVGLMREYNSTPTNKKTRKSEIRQSINKLASDLGYTVKGKIGDKIDVLNAKGEVIRKINITSDEVTVTPEVIEKTKELAQGWFGWNGNELDYHIDASQLGLTWQEIRRAKADIDAGKTESTNINRVANAINEYGNMESLPLVRGFGGNYERIDVTGEDLFWANKANETTGFLSDYDNVSESELQSLKELSESDEKEFEQYSDLYGKFTNEDGSINWEEALKYEQANGTTETTANESAERKGGGNDIGNSENSQLEKEKGVNKTQNHQVYYNGKVVDMGYITNPKEQFKYASQRISDNLGTGGNTESVGYVKTPDGKIFEVSRSNKSAKLLSGDKLISAQDKFAPKDADLQSTGKSFTPIDKTAFEKLLDKLKKAFPNVKVELFGKGNMESAKKALEKYGVDIVDMLSVWHGSPHNFDKFSTDKMGTGEGAQAFGWGLYFTDLESIARNYAKALTKQLPSFGGKTLNVLSIEKKFGKNKINGRTLMLLQKALSSVDGIATKQNLIDYINENTLQIDIEREEALTLVDTYNDGQNKRNLYKVKLHEGKTPEQYTWLEWDKVISDEVRNIAINIIQNSTHYELGDFPFGRKYELINKLDGNNSILGSDLYKELANLYYPEYISKSLLENGIDGVKYPAESIASGATSDTARGFNYVVFDENAIKIEEKIQFLKTKDGTIYGFKTPDGKVFINTDNLNANTPIHEYAHIWQSVFPQEFARGIELLKLSPQGQALIREIQKNPAYKGKTISEIQAEALVTAIGNKGEAIFNSNPTLFNKFKEWLSDFFKKIGDKLGLDTLSPDDKLNMFTKKVTGELLGGKVLSKEVGTGTDIDLQMDKAIKQSKDIELVKDKDGNLLAPNGKKSNLNETQWRIVRTDAFKNWFGDWENNPKEASKVVDENGEPLVVYHGTKNFGFNEFLEKQGTKTKSKMQLLFGMHFASDKSDASLYTKGKGGVYDLFLNIKTPIDLLSGFVEKGSPLFDAYLKLSKELNLTKDFKNNLDYQLFTKEGNDGGKSNEVQRIFITQFMLDKHSPSKVYSALKNSGFDGVIYEPYQLQGINTVSKFSQSYISFSPNQIKLADGTNTTFNPESNDIRFQVVNNPSKEEIGKAYELAQAYLEATDFEYNTEARDEFIEKVRNNPLSKAIFTETQLEKIYDGQVLSSVDKIRVKYKMLIYDIKNNNRLSKQQIQQKQQEMADDIKWLINNNLKSITGKQAEKFINLANKAVTNNSPAYLARIINQIANLADQRTYQKAKTLYEIIKARSKRKGGVQSGKLTGVLQDFATINPLDVSDIAKYVELAEKVKQASNVVKQPTDADSDLVYDEVQAYVKAQQDEINSNAINDTLEDDAMTFFTVLDNKTKAKFGDDKTFDDLNESQQREVLDSITKDDIKKYGLTDEERDMVEAFKEIKTEQKRQDFITATYVKIGELKDLLANSVGVITQSPAEKEITDALLNVKLDDMTATEMARVLKLINGITQNNDYSGGGAFVAQQKAVESVAKLNALKSEIGTFRNIKKRLAKIANLSSISESMARGAELGAKLKRAIGFSEFTKAVGIAKNYAHELGEQFAKNKFSKSVFKPINQARLTVYASVIQTKIGEEVNEAEHIQNWKEILESNIKNLRKSGNEDNIKEADVLETAISEIIGDANSFADIAMNLSKTNKELLDVHTFFVNAGAEQKPRLRENANLVHNEEIEEYNDYTKLSFTNIITNSKIDVGDSIFSGGATGIVKKKSKSLMDRSNYNNLKDTMKMDLNWINNQFKALASNEYDIQTSKPIETLRAIFNADNEKVREILGTDNFTLLRDRLIRMTNKKIHESTIIDDLMSVLGRAGRTLALGNATPIGMAASALKQSAVLASTIINNIGKNQIPLDLSIFSRNKRKQENILKLLAQSDIISRRASGAGGFYDTGKIENKISDNIAQKGLKILGEGQKAVSDFSMMALRYTDIKAADISWITYYKNYLRKKGLPFDDNNEFKNPNKDAMVYAETMVERSQGANTDVSQADMWEYSKGLSSIFMPFMAFAVQANVRMFNNYHNIYNGKNRGEALKDIAAFNAEIALFNVVKLGISASIVNGLIPLLKSAIIGGDDDDEVEKARKAKQLREGFWQQLAQDHYGIMPLFDDNVTKPIANKLWKNRTGSDVPLIPLYNGDKSMKDGMQLGLFQGAINKYYDISKDLDIMYNNPVFGGFDGMEKEVTEYEYKGNTYKIVHSGGYVSKDMYISNRQEGRFKNIEVPLDVLVDFVNNPSEFKKVKTLAWESASVDKKFKLELDDNQKAFAAFIFAVDALSLMGASDNLLNRTNNAMRKELTKKTIKKNVYE